MNNHQQMANNFTSVCPIYKIEIGVDGDGCGIPHPRKPTARIVDHRLATSHRSHQPSNISNKLPTDFIEKVAQGLGDFIYCCYYYCI